MIPGLVPAVVQSIVTKAVLGASSQTQAIPAANVEEVAQAVAKELMKDPVAVNQLNAEPIHRSRVMQGVGIAGFMQAVAVVLSFIWPEQDWVILFNSVGVIVGGLWTAWGRLGGQTSGSGLRPTGS